MPRRATVRPLLLAVLFGLAGAALPAAATNLSFLSDTAMSNFTEADMKLFNAALDEALNQAEVGQTRSWANAKTKASGDIRVVDRFERDGQPCRTLAVANKARGTSGSGQYRLCRQTSGKWGLVVK